ncbi:MAG: GNAT family N-acetyltransferase [Pseudomonadota bacterium]|nr:GNAT family N-acetyltransferase [Pseudomonadota bacterium]
MTAIRDIQPGADNDPAKVAALEALFRDHDSRALIANLTTRVGTLDVAGRTFPITLNDASERGNCYICRPSAAYIDYGLDETRHFVSNPVLRGGLRGLIRACAPILAASGLDRQVQVNNWLFSTNPVPALSPRDASAIRDRLLGQYPDRAIVLRSLNRLADADTIDALAQTGFTLLPARQVYIFADRRAEPKLTKNMKWDRRHLRTTPHDHVPNDAFTRADFDRAAALYGLLYLDKYTPLNPQYTSLCLRELHRTGIVEYAGLRDRDTGELAAVTGLFRSGTTLTQPIVGYDTARPLEAGLYRMMMALSQKRASAEGLFFNMSAGAASFKRLRGAVPVIEYTAVYTAHLGRRQRAAVGLMEGVLTRVGVPILERFGL